MSIALVNSSLGRDLPSKLKQISGGVILKTHCLSRLVLPLLLFYWVLPGALMLCSQEENILPVMPLPAHVTLGQGHFLIDGSLDVALEGYTDRRLVLAKQRFLNRLSRETGIPFRNKTSASQACFTIVTAGASAPVQQLGEDESYHLNVTANHVRLTAANPLGALHGLQTFLQLVRITPDGFSVPVVAIDDQPRFPWRGLMLDAGRHFMPVTVIERNLDGMEAVKLNVFHWHLSEDQGFRVESKQFPLLQQRGSGGQYYTQKQIGEVIQYARERGIRVVPEFDMPCHTSSWLAGYPELASGTGPYQPQTRWGIFDPAMDPTRESTYQFIDKFLGEMTALFPDAYFHIGGDECNGKEWDVNPRIKAYMKAHGLLNNAALQSYFTGRVQKLVASHHKIMEGWDEVLQPDTPHDVVIQSWRGPEALAAAARKGNRALLSAGYYIDLNQSAAQHYLADPLAGDGASLTAEQKTRVLGGEATMWSEFVTPENVDSRIWPRTAAIAERLWSPQKIRDIDSMYQRLAIVSQKLESCGLEHQSSTNFMLQRMSGENAPQALRVLAEVVQPPEGYTREELKEYNTLTPLNRLVDAVPPESKTARKFGYLVKLIIAGHASPQQWQEARNWLVLWRDNDAKLHPLLENSELTEELIPLSRDLSQVAVIGLQVLDDLQLHHRFDAATLQKQIQLLDAAAKPQAVLLDKVVPSVQLLVQAAELQSHSLE
jgi:hexosaminidase